MFKSLVDTLRNANGYKSYAKCGVLGNLSCWDSSKNFTTITFKNEEIVFIRHNKPNIIVNRETKFDIIDNEFQLSVGNCVYFAVKFYISDKLIEFPIITNSITKYLEIAENEGDGVSIENIVLNNKEKFKRLSKLFIDNPQLKLLHTLHDIVNDVDVHKTYLSTNTVDIYFSENDKIKITKNGKLKYTPDGNEITFTFKFVTIEPTTVAKGLFLG
jgi:hypothetical protein